jgi:ATP-dependent DNA ligase
MLPSSNLASRPRRQTSVRLQLDYEIKHDGFRLMARRDPVGIRLITRRGNDWTARYPLVVEAVNHLKVRSYVLRREEGGCLPCALCNFEQRCARLSGSRVE